jgi:hypothetical protein
LPFSPFDNGSVAAKFDALPPPLRLPLLHLRQTILEVGSGLPDIGGLVETLKWDEPAYHPVKARMGTTVRINALRGSDTQFALYVPCQTKLIEIFKQHYPADFTFEGKRAVLFESGKHIPIEPLRHCIGMALTYHRSLDPRCA